MITIELVDDIHCRFRNILKINNVITVIEADHPKFCLHLIPDILVIGRVELLAVKENPI